ncbi:unnamed protein product [Fusarium graminearum]|uniref:Aminotransferase class I/classII large domain-containing protein n=1 Tax=Gibberella zeae TaxID=5518 RepID=A0A4E9E017_GIBZA|nr:unnamed protein product [Fusarium graminearum]
MHPGTLAVTHLVSIDTETSSKMTPLLVQLSRAEITSCPSYGARIVAEILDDEQLYNQWLNDLIYMSNRMKAMRDSLYQGLVRRRIDMFSMTGLSTVEVAMLRDKHHIYLLPSGRLSVTGCKPSPMTSPYRFCANMPG